MPNLDNISYQNAIPKVIETDNNRSYTIGSMEKPGDIIKAARESHDPKLSQAGLAELVGISQVAIKKIEANTTVKSKHLAKIAQILSIDLRKLDPSLSKTITPRPVTKVTEQSRRGIVTISGGDLVGDKDLPVYASTQGGRGALIVSTDPVEWVSRPEPLAKVKDGYGLIVSEDSMEPEFEAGDIALVHPKKPPKIGRTCIFYSEQVDGTVHACIKRLRRVTTDSWHVTQFNPPEGEKRDYTLKRSEWQRCEVTVGKYNGR